jgi:hypothetical protein
VALCRPLRVSALMTHCDPFHKNDRRDVAGQPGRSRADASVKIGAYSMRPILPTMASISLSL